MSITKIKVMSKRLADCEHFEITLPDGKTLVIKEKIRINDLGLYTVTGTKIISSRDCDIFDLSYQ